MVETTESFLRIEAIFYEAFAAPGEARAELIETRCGGDRELAAEVRLLLEASEAEERLAASRRLEPGAGRESQAEARQIGPYCWIACWGAAAWGRSIWRIAPMASSSKKVAIKLIDLPFATGVFQKRFRQERQDTCRIAASLHRPACWMAE